MPEFHNLTLDELTGWMSNAQPGSVRHGQALAELERRRFLAERETGDAQLRAAVAEEKAANAAIETAHHAEKNAKYMLWSVVMAALSAFISLATTLYTNWPKK
jgi:multidrug resistance efflux pump